MLILLPPMQHVTYLESVPDHCILIYGQNANKSLTAVTVLVDPNLTGGALTPTGFIDCVANGTYASPIALVRTSQVEFDGLKQALASHVTDVHVEYNSSTAAVTKFGYKQQAALAALFETVKKIDTDLLAFRDEVRAEFHELKEAIKHRMGGEHRNGAQALEHHVRPQAGGE